jgi:hypothetical protein
LAHDEPYFASVQNPEGGITLPWLSSYTNLKSPQTSGWLFILHGSSDFPVGKFVGINTYADRFALENHRVSSIAGGYKSRPPQ